MNITHAKTESRLHQCSQNSQLIANFYIMPQLWI